MASRTEFRIKGAREMERVLSQLPAKIEGRVVDNALRAGARIIRDEAKDRVPVDEGDLRAAIVVRKATKKLMRRGGTGQVVIGFKRPESGRAHLAEYGQIFQPAQPFMRPALDTKGATAIKVIGRSLGENIEKAAQKLAGEFKSSGLAQSRRRR